MTDDRTGLAHLPPHIRRRILERLNRADLANGGEPQLARAPRTDRLRLSWAQERLWVLDRLSPGSAAYHIPAALLLRGPLDVEALRVALRGVVARHEVLRTRLVESADGTPMQVIEEEAELSVPLVDLSGLETEEREAQSRERADAFAREPFDLGEALKLRAMLIRVGEGEHVLLFVMHHVASDGWSISVLVREVGELYAAAVAGRPAKLEELPVQYADYAVWQRSWLEGTELERQLRYWREQLEDAPPVLTLPTDRPRPKMKGDRGGAVDVRVGASTMDAVRTLAQTEGGTVFMVLLSAWSWVLSRYARSTEVVVGSPIAGRRSTELDGLIGFFVNTLALRVDAAGRPTFRELVRRVKRVTLEAYEHQDVPFEKLVSELDVSRDTSVTPLFQVMFALQNTPSAELVLEGLSFEPMELTANTSKFDLVMAVAEAESGELEGALEYDSDLFDPETVERLVAAFGHFLNEAVAQPDVRAVGLSLAGEQIQEQARHNAVGPTADVDLGRPLHAWFAERAIAAPERRALVFGESSMTYGELHARSNGLARVLRERGVQTEDRVGLCLKRSPELLVSILAVLKAGAAYVPLDSSYPDARLQQLEADVSTRVVIGHPRDRARFRDDVRWLDVAEVLSCPDAVEPPPVQVSGANLAYIMFTSGSTGRPKGVGVEHRSIVRLVRGANFAEMGPDETWLMFAPPEFDASTLEIWAALLHGADLVIVPSGPEALRDLAAQIGRHRVSSVWLTAGLFHTMVDLDVGQLGTVRQLLAGGDVLSPEHVRRFLEGSPGTTVINGYGPTEGTTFTTCYPMRSARDVEPRVPIGWPITHSSAYVLDEELRLVPDGVVGELCVGGVGVARGYYGRSALTAERFVPDPIGEHPGGRLYRTGDLVRRRPDGALDFLGRMDTQVKLRGFRIELGEIESALRAEPAVRDTVVVVREDPPGEKRLVAYVVGDALDEERLRSVLAARLPPHMVPSGWVMLDELPLTISGKVNRRALPLPEMVSGDGWQAPHTEPEAVVASIFAEMLGLERVGRNGDFFALGGHSLLAMRLVSAVRERLGAELSLRDVFEGRTVGGIAARIGGERAIPPITRAARESTTSSVSSAVSWAQERLWVLDRLSPGSAAYHIPAALLLRGPLDVEALRVALRGVVARHEVLRTRLVESADGTPMQVIEEEAELSVPLVDLSGLETEEREAQSRERADAFAREPFDLGEALKLRAMLIRVGEGEHVLLFVMHHVASDGWSISVLVREVGELYAAAVAGRPAKLEELPVQYADYAVWQRSWLEGTELERQLRYWREQLEDAPPVLTLPTDRPRPKMKGDRGGAVDVRVGASTMDAVRTLAQTEGGTVFMVLLSAWSWVLSRYARSTEVVVGSPIAGRRSTELDGLIGFFVNTLALRVDAAGRPTFRELVRRVKRVTLEAYEHQDVPFEKLVSELDVSRDTSVTPLFQVMFALQNTPSAELVLEGLSFEPMELTANTSKFDLVMAVAEAESGELEGALEYDSDLFDPETVERLVAAFGHFLNEAVAQPDVRAVGLSLAGEQIQEQARHNAVGPTADVDLGRPLHAWFAERAIAAPERRALVFGESSMTYGELHARSNGLARVLRERGVQTEDRVGLCLKRSPELLVSILAVLKAGAAYVPLDSSYPDARLQQLEADVSTRVVIGHPRDRARFRDDVRWLDVAEVLSCPDAVEPPPVQVSGANLAYIMFTSGSTGRPKGVGVDHRSIVRLVTAPNFLRTGPDETWLMFATPEFDASTIEIWGALLHGSDLIIVPSGPAELDDISRAIRSHRVTTVFLTTGLLHAMVDQHLDGLVGVRQVISGGDVISSDHVRRLLGASPSTTFVAAYGPTEGASVSTCHRMSAPMEVEPRMPIGQPLAWTSAYVLDEELRLVPDGVAGELCVGEAGIARGYHGRSALTAERFIPDPFGRSLGGRLYRTGDLARRRPDGVLEFLGRTDHQVKLRGFRVEIGEVEGALRAQPGVRDTVVIVREDRPGDKRLVAYVIGEDLDAEQLRGSLGARLPSYMVPSACVILDEIPLTTSGKLNRRALPVPSRDEAYAAARTPKEATVASIFAEVLGLPRVGRDGSFFALGGDSILAIQLVGRARRLGLQLEVRDVFEHQTVSALAAQGRDRETSVAEQGQLAGPVPMSPILNWFFGLGLVDESYFNQAVLLAVDDEIDTSLLAEAWKQVTCQHDMLRARFERTESGVTARYEANDPELVVEEADLGDAAEWRARLRDRACAAQSTLRLGEGPVQRMVRFRLPNGQQRLLWVIHHAVEDAVTLRVLVEDLWSAYTSLLRGEQFDFGPKTTSYRQYVEALTAWSRGSEAEAEASYWREQASEGKDSLGLSRDRDPSASRVTVELELSRESTAAVLTGAARAYRATVHEVLLAGLARACRTVLGTETLELRVSIEGHGRAEHLDGVDVSRTVGWFTGLYPHVLRDHAAWGLDRLLIEQKERTRRIPNGGVGYGALRHLRADRELSEGLDCPSTDLIFNYLGRVDVGTTLPQGLSLADEDVGASQSERDSSWSRVLVTASVERDRLLVAWTCDEGDAPVVRRMAEAHRSCLDAVAAHCSGPDAFSYTPSDFPLARLTHEALHGVVGARRDIAALYPLTPLQQGLLMHRRMSRGSGLYFTQFVLELRSGLDIEAFRQAWSDVVARHELLRAEVVDVAEGPLWRVHDAVDVPFQVLDWSNEPDAEARLERWMKEDRERDLELHAAPLMRVTIMKHAAGRVWCAWSVDHLVIDGWSLGNVVGPLTSAYQARIEGREPSASPVASYGRFVEWLQRRGTESWRELWKGALASVEEPTTLKLSEATGQEGAGTVLLRVDESSAQRVGEAARAMGVTVGTLLQGAWAYVLSVISGQARVVYGQAVHGRPADLEGVEEMVGLFVQTIPTPVAVERRLLVHTYLKDLHRHLASLREHQWMSLAEAHELTGLPPGEPLFQTLFALENYPAESAMTEQGGALVAEVVRAREQSGYALAAEWSAAPLALKLEYDKSRFSESTATHVASLHVRVVELLAAHRDLPLGQLELLDERGRARVARFSEGSAGDLADALDRVASFAESNGDAEALCDDRVSMTYEDVWRRSGELARALLERGVEPEERVAIAAERRSEWVVSLLGVMRAGAVALSVDLGIPLERQRYMLGDSGVRRAVVFGETSGAGWPGHVERLDYSVLQPEDSRAALPPRHRDQAAYVIYTSGSTGLPKGVEVSYRGLLNVATARSDLVGVGLRELQFASPGFDASIWEIFGALTTGGTLVLAPPESLRPGGPLERLVEEQKIELMLLAPSALAVVDPMTMPSLKIVLSGGEALSTGVARSWASKRLVNAYGPTECTVCATMARVDADAAVTIGKPVRGTWTHVVDEEMRLLPVGFPGELLLGGLGVARGYVGRAGLTASRFVPDPFGDEPGGRLYRTGDLVRWLPSGELEYLGRLDSQVKLRGFRVELGEIESLLRDHPGVRNAVVLMREDHGDKRLVAYVVGEAVDTEHLQSMLGTRLPSYMVPTAWVVLDELPLTTSGKVNRRALPPPGMSSGDGYEAPHSETEAVVAGLYAEILGLERVGRRDDFFALGGHSLLAMRLVGMLDQRLGKTITLRDLFEGRTVAETSDRLERRRAALRPARPPLSMEGADCRALSIRSDEVLLSGELLVPAGDGPVPVVIIVHGSGELDRDGNGPGLRCDSYRMLAARLAEHGVASLRYDKRSLHPLDTVPPTARTLDDYAADVAAWIVELRSGGTFSTVSLVGHSEGAIVSMLAAKRARVDALVHFGSPSRPLVDSLRDELRAEGRASDVETYERLLDSMHRGETYDGDIPTSLSVFLVESDRPWLESLLDRDPAALVKEADPAPTVIVGETDLQIGAEDAERLHRVGAKIVKVPFANHLMKHEASREDPQPSYEDASVPLAHGVVEAICDAIGARRGYSNPTGD